MSILEGGPVRKFLKGLTKRNPEAKLTLSQIDITIHDITRYINEHKTTANLLRTDSQNPVIREIDASDILFAMADEELVHVQKLENLLPKLRDLWSEVQRTLV